MIQAPTIKTHEGIVVVRDDLTPGGTKTRLYEYLYSKYDEVVYACSSISESQPGLAMVAQRLGKKATIFCAARADRTDQTTRALALGAAVYEERPGYMSVVVARAKDYARVTGAYLSPLGFDTPDNIDFLAKMIKGSVKTPPKEVWAAVGTGVILRSLQRAFPRAASNGVVVGKPPTTDGLFNPYGNARFFSAPEKFFDGAAVPPPFPSCPHYDAKAWRFIQKYAAPSALFWNVSA